MPAGGQKQAQRSLVSHQPIKMQLPNLLNSLVDLTRLGAANALHTFEFNTKLKLYVCFIDFTDVHIPSLIQAAFASNSPAIALDLQITA